MLKRRNYNQNSSLINKAVKKIDFQENQRGFIETEGIVKELYPGANFKVELNTGQEILAHLSGKMRINKIKILPGDKVIIEISPYDLTKGRIIKRL